MPTASCAPAHPNGQVWFDGARRRMLGRVSMDLIAVDITDCDAARPGAMVELFGPNLPSTRPPAPPAPAPTNC
jgi:alanine racemase